MTANGTTSRTESVPVQIRGSLEKPPTTGQVEIVTWSANERSRRALKFLGICWGIGLFCVIMPIVHFFLVPGMFVAGLVGFARLSGQESLVLGGEGPCPECGKTFHIAKATNRFPMDELCENCKASVSISRADSN
jgi:hypothetical protein